MIVSFYLIFEISLIRRFSNRRCDPKVVTFRSFIMRLGDIMTYATQGSTDTSFKSGESDFIRKAMKQPLLTKEDEQQLTRSWKHDRNSKALDRLIRAYSRLAVSSALKYKKFGLPVSDLIH